MTVIDTTTNAVVGAPIPVGTNPFGVGVDPTVHRAYVANQTSNTVTVIDTTTNIVGTPIPVGTFPVGVGVDPTVHRAYVANSGSSTVTVIDTTSNTFVAPIGVGTGPLAWESGRNVAAPPRPGFVPSPGARCRRPAGTILARAASGAAAGRRPRREPRAGKSGPTARIRDELPRDR